MVMVLVQRVCAGSGRGVGSMMVVVMVMVTRGYHPLAVQPY